VIKDDWELRIARAELLTAISPASADLLSFYAVLLRAQRSIHLDMRTRTGWEPCGALERDVHVIGPMLGQLLTAVADAGPELLSEDARGLLALGGGFDDYISQMLLDYWHAPSDVAFFAKASLQPYAGLLASLGRPPIDRHLAPADNRCPFCGGVPQFAIIQEPDARSDSGGRRLACSLCQTTWPFKRILCAHCGEEDEKKLGYFHSSDYDHVRVHACETCRRYLKAIDLTRLGTGVPLVDEVAAAPLDAWAREHGYSKIELNLVGL
jgi:FdhE protein